MTWFGVSTPPLPIFDCWETDYMNKRGYTSRSSYRQKSHFWYQPDAIFQNMPHAHRDVVCRSNFYWPNKIFNVDPRYASKSQGVQFSRVTARYKKTGNVVIPKKPGRKPAPTNKEDMCSKERVLLRSRIRTTRQKFINYKISTLWQRYNLGL